MFHLTQLYLLVLATISFTTILSGLFYFLLGQFRLGRFVRFIPYPVIGGFLAGSGWLLFRGSIGVMADVSLSIDQLPTLLQADFVARWLPGVIFAVVLYTAIRRFSHFLIMPGVIIGGQIGPRLHGRIGSRFMERAIGGLFGVIGLAMLWLVARELGVI